MFWCCCTPAFDLCGSPATEYFEELPAFGEVTGGIVPLWSFLPDTDIPPSEEEDNISIISGQMAVGSFFTAAGQYSNIVQFCIKYPASMYAGWGWQCDVVFNGYYDPASCPWTDQFFGWESRFRYDMRDVASAALNHDYSVYKAAYGTSFIRTGGAAYAGEQIDFRSVFTATTYNSASAVWAGTLKTYVDDVLWKTSNVFAIPSSQGYMKLHCRFIPKYSYESTYYTGSDELKWLVDSFIFSYTD